MNACVLTDGIYWIGIEIMAVQFSELLSIVCARLLFVRFRPESFDLSRNRLL